MLSKLKEIAFLAGSAVLLLLGIKLGSKLKEGEYNKDALKAMEEAQKKAQEADREANEKKNNVTVDNVADELNKLC